MLNGLKFNAVGILFSIVMLLNFVPAQAFMDTNNLIVSQQTTVESLADAQIEGLKFYVDEVFEGAAIVTVYVCMSRRDLPDGVSSSFLLTLKESYDGSLASKLVSVSQQMVPEDNGSSYDVGGFQVRADMLQYLSLFFSYSSRDSGLYSEADARLIEVRFRSIASELTSDELTFSDNLGAPFCGLPSGRYLGGR